MSLLSRKGLLAITAVVDIAVHARARPVSAKALAARNTLPTRHLVPVLQAGRVKVQQPLIITDFDEPEPDVTILKEPLYLRKPTVADVELVIEVSDSTYKHDHDHKLPAYLAAGCRRVWLINISDHALRRRAYELVAEVFDLAGRAVLIGA